ncbi:MAG: shikimate kinase [Parachlamydiaceae bacterium]|nr:shikimate kinase [Parachlamydiaceae bacterium]
MNFILCGLPRCGKTTIGQKLAFELNLSFRDTDRMIEEMYKKKMNMTRTCQDIYQLEGSDFFRQIESDAIHSLKGISSTIISSGGGSVLNKDNCVNFKQLGRVIYLNLNPLLIWKRLLNEKGSSFLINQTEQNFYEMVNERILIYESIANDTIKIEHKNVEEIVSEIKTLIQTTK